MYDEPVIRPLKKSILFYLLLAHEAKIFPGLTYAQLYERINHVAEASVRLAVIQLESEGFVARLKTTQAITFRLSSQGRSFLEAMYPSALFKPELRTTEPHVIILKKKSGLIKPPSWWGRLYPSVYVSMLPFAEHHAELIWLSFPVSSFSQQDKKELIYQSFNLEKISKEYANVSGKIERLLTKLILEKDSSHNVSQQYRSITKKLLSVFQLDPCIHEEYLPIGFAGSAVVRLMLQLEQVICDIESHRDSAKSSVLKK